MLNENEKKAIEERAYEIRAQYTPESTYFYSTAHMESPVEIPGQKPDMLQCLQIATLEHQCSLLEELVETQA